jgi:hypothetical protein
MLGVLACGAPSKTVHDGAADAGPSASASQFDFACDHAVLAWDEWRAPLNASAACRLHLGAQSGAAVTGVPIHFLSEAGWVDEVSTDAFGNTSALHHVGDRAPLITTPGEGQALPAWFELTLRGNGAVPEPSRADPLHLAAGVLNPRDNLVSLVAVVRGDEAFTDSNGDGVWEAGEAFEDLAEPWLDNNDNGAHDDDEPFIDANGDGVWTPGDGTWSHDTLIWKQTGVVWLGAINPLDAASAAPPISSTPNPVTLRCPAGLPIGSPCAQATDVTGVGAAVVDLRLVDPWLNAWSLLGEPSCSVTTTPHIVATVVGWTNPTHLRLRVGDAREPNLPPIDQTPKRIFTYDEVATLSCTFGTQSITVAIRATID